MKALFLSSLCFGIVRVCVAGQVLAEYDWSRPAQSGQLTAGLPVTIDGRAALKIVNTNDTPLQAQFLKVLNPAITKKLYAIAGEVKYEGVRGTGYLEMWNYFPPAKPGMVEAAYFSRTLGDSGEMGKLTGTSGWRRFMLPFDRAGASGPPTRLEINLFLPAQGTVYLSPVQLVEYIGNFGGTQTDSANAWWPDWAGGLIGGIGGGVLGCLGGLLAWLASKGKARGFVVATLKSLIALGVLSAAAGFAALSLRQPYGVWFVPLLLGVILLAILPFRLKEYQRRYDDLEMRKMTALDA
jgi:hypothetical protein